METYVSNVLQVDFDMINVEAGTQMRPWKSLNVWRTYNITMFMLKLLCEYESGNTRLQSLFDVQNAFCMFSQYFVVKSVLFLSLLVVFPPHASAYFHHNLMPCCLKLLILVNVVVVDEYQTAGTSDSYSVSYLVDPHSLTYWTGSFGLKEPFT